MADQQKTTDQPKSTLIDVITYLKTDADGIKGTPTSTGDVKPLTAEDRLELRFSLDKVRGK